MRVSPHANEHLSRFIISKMRHFNSEVDGWYQLSLYQPYLARN